MQKAKAQQIDNESIYKTLVDGFKNNIIGLSSNAITKLWNRPDLEDNPLKYDDAINVICAMSNYAIDFPKTGKNLLIGEYEQLYKELIPNPKNMFKPSNIKYPQFFKFAKGKKSSSLEVYTNSPMDRIPQYIDIEVGRKHFMYDVGTDEDNKKNKFDYKNLMNNSYVLDYKGVKPSVAFNTALSATTRMWSPSQSHIRNNEIISWQLTTVSLSIYLNHFLHLSETISFLLGHSYLDRCGLLRHNTSSTSPCSP